MLHCLHSRNRSSVAIAWKFRTIFESHPNVAQSFKYKLNCSSSQRCIHLSTASGNQIEPGLYESNALPRDAKTVICGGGIMGAAVAYHLALQGLGSDIVLLEQDRFV